MKDMKNKWGCWCSGNTGDCGSMVLRPIRSVPTVSLSKPARGDTALTNVEKK